MKKLATITKVQTLIESALLKKLPKLEEDLLSGDLLKFEKELKNSVDQLYNGISEILLLQTSKELLGKLEQRGRAANLRKLEKRKMAIQIGTGHVIKVDSIYAHVIPPDYEESRHLLGNYWKTISNSSLSHIDKVCMSSVLCPSYMVANQLLMHMGIKQGVSRVRKLTNDVGIYCKELEVKLSLEAEENLKGKRVIIGIDGGRTRTRTYLEQINKNGNKTYKTNWRPR